NPSHLFVPASNRKLFTGALALDLLGPNFQYHTYLFRTGKVDASGVLNGNLVIKPQGDPTFSNTIVRNAPTDWIFRDWVTKVQAEGIKSVAGELVVDCSDWNMMDLTPKGWPTRIKSDYYAPQSSPLTLNENIIEIRVKPSAAGQPGIIEFIPPAEGYPIVNKTVTGAGKGGISVNREADGHIEVTGAPSTRSTGQTYAVPCDNPTLFAAAVLRHHLHQAGIEIRGAVRILTTKSSSSAPRPENIIAVYISPSMAEIVKTMMKHSNNHFAEQLYISLSAIKSQAGGYRTSKQLENEFLARAGINTRELNFEDGCGLSLLNQVSPHHICQLLNYMMRHPAWPAFFDSLPVAGRDGTLRGRMRNDNIAQKVHAKTGFVNQVSALSGYLTLNQGRTLVFSFLVNDVHSSTGAVKSAEDHLCEILSLLSL
ncbi:MAG: D-alanyl-D-alanine carboxypeptidase/D-alanyl-D-alanine-endopeptidase, partial [Candidatus Sumerlaeota bacterium]|nr:D-alanyl-D-alanine carboxypeptidase/D-alanyl-D-alanine-endopeptidase [Candidatus Sumerlaeota bacterium]